MQQPLHGTGAPPATPPAGRRLTPDQPSTNVKNLVIIGAGGLGREVADTIASLNEKSPAYRLLGFVDDNPRIHGSEINGVRVLGGREALKTLCARQEICATMAITNVPAKRDLVAYFGTGLAWERIIHPLASVSRSATLGTGVIIQAFVVVAANARLGNHCVINASSGIGHDVVLGDYSAVMSQCDVTGNARLGAAVFMGTGARVLPQVQVADEVQIGAGAVVFKDVEPRCKVLGNPARVIG